MTLSAAEVKRFRKTIYDYYEVFGRKLPWRDIDDPYKVLVSEYMLQQTQVDRVKQKYIIFIRAFPTVKQLAEADFGEVLKLWHGLGYNRRAMALHSAARKIVEQHDGVVPPDPEVLQTLPGIGPYTAAAIAAFGHNKPAVLIETNIRTVFIHFFFRNKDKVSDAELLPLVIQTLDSEQPGRWYSALMDYGVMLKKTEGNASRQSTHYTKQSRFEGSDRQLRGRILKALLEKTMKRDQLVQMIGDERGERIVGQLLDEGFIEENRGTLSIRSGARRQA